MIRCAACKHALTSAVKAVGEGFKPNWEGWELFEEIIPEGLYWEAGDGFWQAENQGSDRVLVINSGDASGTKDNLDRLGSGCCGNSSHIRNICCDSCGIPIGTNIDDCYTGRYIYFPTQLISVTPETA